MKKNNTSNIGKVLIIVCTFIFAFLIRLWNLNHMGLTWDEPAQVVDGYKFITLAKEGDFQDPYWYDHPFHPPLTKYLYGFAGQFDIQANTPNPKPLIYKGEPIFNYDLTYSRLISVVFSSLSVVLVMLLGFRFINTFTGFTAGIILATLPIFVGLSQIASIESIVFFFYTLTVYLFCIYLSKPKKYLILCIGISLGLSLLTKYTNILLIPTLMGIYFLKDKFAEKKIKIIHVDLLMIFVIGLITFIALWPMPWLHFKDFVEMNYQLRVADTKHSIPEVFFGRLMFVPKIYYAIYFLITTPFIILSLFLYGLKKISRSNNWFFYSLIIWFLIPFILSLYNFRQHGIRYIIQIYGPLALLAGYGLYHVVLLKPKIFRIKAIVLIPFLLLIYCIVILFRITPYYLDYFNILVGGPKNVYEKRMFHLGWWGQGVKEAAEYINKNGEMNSQIGVAVVPWFSRPPMPKMNVSEYKEGIPYDYIMVSHFNVIRLGFDDTKIRSEYKRVYTVTADGAHLVEVYKKK